MLGSCTGSSVLLELILNGPAPAALVLAEPDEILTLGALVAEHVFDVQLPVLCIGHAAFAYVPKAFIRRLIFILLHITCIYTIASVLLRG